jgi:hypothetical protein
MPAWRDIERLLGAYTYQRERKRLGLLSRKTDPTKKLEGVPDGVVAAFLKAGGDAVDRYGAEFNHALSKAHYVFENSNAGNCPRCGGLGYIPGTIVAKGVCFKCHGSRNI